MVNDILLQMMETFFVWCKPINCYLIGAYLSIKEPSNLVTNDTLESREMTQWKQYYEMG